MIDIKAIKARDENQDDVYAVVDRSALIAECDRLREATEPEVQPPEVRRNDDGSLDEVVAHNAFVHLEQMDDDQWWLGVTVGLSTVHVNLSSKKRIRAIVEVDDPKPPEEVK